MQKSSSSQNWVVYVWLAALYGVVSLYLRNIDLFNSVEVLGILAVILLAISLLVWALYKVLHNLPQSGLISFMVVVLFFSYGHAYNLIMTMVADGPLTQHAFCFPAALAFATLVIYFTIKHPHFAARMTPVLNFMTVILVCFPLIKVVDYLYYEQTLTAEPPAPIKLNYSQTDALPDIYYVILDGYSREDWLAEWFDFDNSEFIQALEARGFYVADQSCSNYIQTDLSIPSALSMQYLDLPDNWFAARHRERAFLKYYAAKYNLVAEALMAGGYTYIQVASHFVTTAFDRRADIVIDYRPSGPYITTDPEAQENFLKALLPTTLLKPFYEHFQDIESKDAVLHWSSAERALMAFDTLKTIPARPEATFTFAHIVKPHLPYNLDRFGNILTSTNDYSWDESNVEGYNEQVRLINTRTLEVIDTLLSDSDTPPIIIIQGDHGWHTNSSAFRWRAPILNAYFVPAEVRSRLYPTISPVNSFRVIFDSTFGTNLGLLDDVSYGSRYSEPFDVTPITGEFAQHTWCPG